jgi:hypothetical protein
MNSLHAIKREHKNLRIVQAKKVMPLIGGLLDAWEDMPNDLRCEIEDQQPALSEALNKINAAMEDSLEAQDIDS